MEAVAQNQGAVVWWKVPPPSGEDKQGSEQAGGDARASRKRAGGGGVAGEGMADKGGRGSVVGGTGAEGDVLEENAIPKTVGFVAYRYRLDGREWHKKGATNVDDAKAVSASIKALSNGLVYRLATPSLYAVSVRFVCPTDLMLGTKPSACLPAC